MRIRRRLPQKIISLDNNGGIGTRLTYHSGAVGSHVTRRYIHALVLRKHQNCILIFDADMVQQLPVTVHNPMQEMMWTFRVVLVLLPDQPN